MPASEIKIDSEIVKIPDSCFTDIRELLSSLSNRSVSFAVRGSIIKADFDQRRSKVVLSEPLRKILGFKSKNIHYGDTNTIPWDLWALVPGFYMEWAAVNKQIFNNKYIHSVKHIFQ